MKPGAIRARGRYHMVHQIRMHPDKTLAFGESCIKIMIPESAS